VKLDCAQQVRTTKNVICEKTCFWNVMKTGTLPTFNDREGPQTQISRSGHSLTLNISKMANDMAIVTMEGE